MASSGRQRCCQEVVSARQPALGDAVTGSSSRSHPALALAVPPCRVTATALRERTRLLSIERDFN